MSNTGIYDAIVAQASAKYNLPASWIKAVIGAESSFDPNVPDRWEEKVQEYAYGPMQILLSTARMMGFNGTGAQLRQPAANIDVGAAYLARLRSQHGDDFRRIYSAYNSGNPDRWSTNAAVSANVTRAENWLGQFQSLDQLELAGIGEGGTIVALAIGAGLLVGALRKGRVL